MRASPGERLEHVPELLADPDCECALAAEAVRDYPRWQARGSSLADYTSPTALAVLGAAAAVYERGERVSLTSVLQELQRVGRLRSVDGPKGLATLAATEAVADHARIASLAALRRLKEAGHAIIRAAAAGDRSAAVKAAQDAEAEAHGKDARRGATAVEVVEALLVEVGDAARHGQRMIRLGLPLLHEAIGLAAVGDMIVVGADSNVGKSSFALELVLATAASGVGCGVVSLEDSLQLMGARILGALAGVSSRRIQQGSFGRDDMARLGAGAAEIKRLGKLISLADVTGGTELDVMAEMAVMASRGARVVVVDYLGEIQASQAQQDRRNELRWICTRLKAYARRLGVVLVAVSQLARPADKQTGHRPTKHDLKESGDITNKSDVILLLWREDEADDAPVSIWVAKGKSGGVGQTWGMRRDESGRLREFGAIGMVERKQRRGMR